MPDWPAFLKTLTPRARAALAHASLLPMAGFADLGERTLEEIHKAGGSFTALEIANACQRAGIGLASKPSRIPDLHKRYRFSRPAGCTPAMGRTGPHVENARYLVYPRDRA